MATRPKCQRKFHVSPLCQNWISPDYVCTFAGCREHFGKNLQSQPKHFPNNWSIVFVFTSFNIETPEQYEQFKAGQIVDFGIVEIEAGAHAKLEDFAGIAQKFRERRVAQLIQLHDEHGNFISVDYDDESIEANLSNCNNGALHCFGLLPTDYKQYHVMIDTDLATLLKAMFLWTLAESIFIEHPTDDDMSDSYNSLVSDYLASRSPLPEDKGIRICPPITKLNWNCGVILQEFVPLPEYKLVAYSNNLLVWVFFWVREQRVTSLKHR